MNITLCMWSISPNFCPIFNTLKLTDKNLSLKTSMIIIINATYYPCDGTIEHSINKQKGILYQRRDRKTFNNQRYRDKMERKTSCCQAGKGLLLVKNTSSCWAYRQLILGSLFIGRKIIRKAGILLLDRNSLFLSTLYCYVVRHSVIIKKTTYNRQRVVIIRDRQTFHYKKRLIIQHSTHQIFHHFEMK